MNNELVTIEELANQIWEIEGVKVEFKKKSPDQIDRLVRPYNFSRLPDNATVDDLKETIHKCIEPFCYTI